MKWSGQLPVAVTSLLALAAFALSFAPALATAAAEGAKTKASGEESSTRNWKEVERGLYASGQVGVGVVLAAPGQAPLMTGLSLGLALGVDLTQELQLEGFLVGVQVGAPASYRGAETGVISTGGDFVALLAGARARYGVLSVSDSQGTKRLFWTLSLGGGALGSAPSSILGGFGAQVLAGTGLRYFTRMRHFSLSVELEAAYGISSGFLLLQPNLGLAYTF